MSDLFDYCRLRYRRTREFIKAAGYQQFVIDERRLIPTARQCVVGGAGYMTTEDLDKFDLAADRYVNGRVYEVEETASDVIREFVVRGVAGWPSACAPSPSLPSHALCCGPVAAAAGVACAQLMRYDRAESVRAIVIHKLVRMLDACRVNNWVAQSDFTGNASRPWGPRKGFVRCYAITAGTCHRVLPFTSSQCPRDTSAAMLVIMNAYQTHCLGRMPGRATCCNERCCASMCTSRASQRAPTRRSSPSSTPCATTAYVHACIPPPHLSRPLPLPQQGPELTPLVRVVYHELRLSLACPTGPLWGTCRVGG